MTHDKYDTDILKTLKSIDASLKSMVLCQDLVQVKMRNFSPF